MRRHVIGALVVVFVVGRFGSHPIHPAAEVAEDGGVGVLLNDERRARVPDEDGVARGGIISDCIIRSGEVFIDIPMERDKSHYHDGFESLARRTRLAYAPILEELIQVFTSAKQPVSV